MNETKPLDAVTEDDDPNRNGGLYIPIPDSKEAGESPIGAELAAEQKFDYDAGGELPRAGTSHRYLPRRELLITAETAVCSERNSQYGEPYDVMKRHTDVLNALGYRGPGGRLLEPFDNAIIEDALKSSRAVGNPMHMDNWVDKAGYAAIGYEAVVLARDTTTSSRPGPLSDTRK